MVEGEANIRFSLNGYRTERIHYVAKMSNRRALHRFSFFFFFFSHSTTTPDRLKYPVLSIRLDEVTGLPRMW